MWCAGCYTNQGFILAKLIMVKTSCILSLIKAIHDFHRDTCTMAKNEMKVIYYPIDTYANQGLKRDIDCCYMIRKGTDKPHVHPVDAICLDGPMLKLLQFLIVRSSLSPR